jgi:hypothetical protein
LAEMVGRGAVVMVMGSGGGGVLFVKPRAAGQPCAGVSVAPAVYVVRCGVFACCGVVVDRWAAVLALKDLVGDHHHNPSELNH